MKSSNTNKKLNTFLLFSLFFSFLYKLTKTGESHLKRHLRTSVFKTVLIAYVRYSWTKHIRNQLSLSWKALQKLERGCCSYLVTWTYKNRKCDQKGTCLIIVETTLRKLERSCCWYLATVKRPEWEVRSKTAPSGLWFQKLFYRQVYDVLEHNICENRLNRSWNEPPKTWANLLQVKQYFSYVFLFVRFFFLFCLSSFFLWLNLPGTSSLLFLIVFFSCFLLRAGSNVFKWLFCWGRGECEGKRERGNVKRESCSTGRGLQPRGWVRERVMDVVFMAVRPFAVI